MTEFGLALFKYPLHDYTCFKGLYVHYDDYIEDFGVIESS